MTKDSLERAVSALEFRIDTVSEDLRAGSMKGHIQKLVETGLENDRKALAEIKSHLESQNYHGPG